MKTLISRTGVGVGSHVIEFQSVEDLAERIPHKGTFARISYTNRSSHMRQHTWYPVLSLPELKTDWQFEAAFSP